MAMAIQRGELVAVPSETVYGLAADALNARACGKIFKAKGRPTTDPLIVHLAHVRELEAVAEINTDALKLAAAFWPGPLTLILKKKNVVPSIVTAGADSIAIRVPSHPIFRALIRSAKRPLAAPSANPFSYISPTTAQHVLNGLGGKIPHIIDGGACKVGIESTIIDVRDPRIPKILRLGVIEPREIEAALGKKILLKTNALSGKDHAVAPGTFVKHYSPKKTLKLFYKISPKIAATISPNEAVLRFSGVTRNNIFSLCGHKPDMKKAARRLFSILRKLDEGGWKRINAELAPGQSSLANAINDRLTRAASK